MSISNFKVEIGMVGKQNVDERDQYGRSLRHRRMKKVFHDSHQTKRLFTPEIKKFLKSWLIRRRKNPYPSRLEKKELAYKTGLTYVQICNWFANWRRKLKNSCKGREKTWGNLIKGYNMNAKGNVEQFSISSNDSIWDDTGFANLDSDDSTDTLKNQPSSKIDHCYFTNNTRTSSEMSDDCEECHEQIKIDENRNSLLSKWLDSAAKYKETSYYYSNNYRKFADNKHSSNNNNQCNNLTQHSTHPLARHREELDAAEALTALGLQARFYGNTATTVQ